MEQTGQLSGKRRAGKARTGGSGAHAGRVSEVAPTSALTRMLDDMRDRGGLQGRDIANIADVSTATVSRWAHGGAVPDLITQTVMADLRFVIERLSDFYAPDEVRLWLHARHPLLDNARAIDFIADDRTREVLAVIDRLNDGAFV